MLRAGPQGMMSSALGVPQRGPFPPGSHPGAHPGSMPQGIVPINGSIQSPVHYMGYFPTPYFAAQSAGWDFQDTVICHLVSDNACLSRACYIATSHDRIFDVAADYKLCVYMYDHAVVPSVC